jgi:predicted permease
MAFLADLVSAFRALRRAPALTFALLSTVALGIGSNAMVLGFIRGFVTRELPLPGVESIVSIFRRDGRDAFGPFSYEEFLSLREQTAVFGAVGAARESQSSVRMAGSPAVLSIAAVTPELAALLGLGMPDGIVISDRLWRDVFASSPAVRGERVAMQGVERAIAGVAPDWLDGLYMGRAIDAWVPLETDTLQGVARTSRTFWILGRLRDGTSASRAETALAGAGGDRPVAVRAYTGITPEVTGGFSRLDQLLPLAAGAVFVIACANVAAFLLSRASARSHETAVRVAIGASRRQLGRQLLADSLVISASGAAGGVLLAFWTTSVIPALLFEQDAAHLVSDPDRAAIAGVSVACLLITTACGLAPLFELRDDDPVAVLRRESAGPSLAMRRLRTGLVVTQMACCSVLVIATGMLLEGFRGALRTSAGQRLGEPLLATITARPDVRMPVGLGYLRKVEAAALSVSGVTSAAWVSRPPGSRPLWQSLRIEPPGLPRREVVIDVEAFTPGTVSRIALAAVAGRLFGGRDAPQSCRVAIVNEEAANAFFSGDPVGRTIHDQQGLRAEIVGVVSMRKDAAAPVPRPTIFYYAEQTGPPLDRTGPQTFQVPVPSETSSAVVDAAIVSPQYFPMIGLPATQGRGFGEASVSDCRIGVINEQAAELYFNGDAVGGAIIDGSGIRTEIVGVVGSTLVGTSQRHPEPTLYLPLGQDYQARMTLMIAARNTEGRLMATLRQSLAAVPGGFAPPVILTLDEHLIRTALAPQRIATLLVSASAAIGLVLGGLGVYSALADSARRRRREIALRLALGAQRWRVVRQVLGEGLRLAGAGTAAGAIGAMLAARGLTRISPGTDGAAAWVWLAAPVVLLAAVCAASVLPARRAMAVDPLSIMREN